MKKCCVRLWGRFLLWAGLLCLVLVLQPIPAQAADPLTVDYKVGDVVVGSFTYAVSDGAATITDYTDNGALASYPMDIPAELGGVPVTAIGAKAFQDYSGFGQKLTALTIPDSVTDIGNNAFRECTALTTVKMPRHLDAFGTGVFGNCKSLATITMPEYMPSVGYQTFYGCRQLASITIPEGVTQIGGYAFQNCTALTTVTFDQPAGNLSIESNAFSGCSKLKTAWVTGTGDIAIPNGLFKNMTSLNTVYLPDSVTSIGDSAFYNRAGLTAIYHVAVDGTATFGLPPALRSIGSQAFRYCSSLTISELPDTLETIGDYAFSGARPLTITKLPENLNSIGADFFSCCPNLTELRLPDSLTSISDNMFKGYSSVESITLPRGITSIGSSAFQNCSKLRTVYYLDEDGETLIAGLPPALRTIGSSAFSGCTKLENITSLPSSVTSVGSEAFAYTGIETFTFGADLSIFASSAFKYSALKTAILDPATTEIPAYMFLSCEALETINFPQGLTTIGTYAFSHCALLSVDLPDSVTTLGSYAFTECHELKTVVMRSNPGFTTLSDHLFNNCVSLTGVTIPDSITGIRASAFAYCKALEQVSLPSTLTLLGSRAFEHSGLTDISIPDSVTSMQAFAGTSSSGYDDPDSTYGCWMFDGCTALVSVKLPAGLTMLPNYIFSGCTSLTSVRIGDANTGKLEVIGHGAFQDCAALPATPDLSRATAINDGAFKNCTAIKTLDLYATDINLGDLYDSLKLGSGIVSGCSGLETITLHGDRYMNCMNISNSHNAVSGPFDGAPATLTLMWDGAPTEIGHGLFAGAAFLKNLEDIPVSVVKYGTDAFSASGLTEVTIPAHITLVGDYAFRCCESLTSLTVENDADDWACNDATQSAVETVGRTMFYRVPLTDITLPQSWTYIPFAMFAYSDIENTDFLTTLPNLTYIKPEAFYSCRSLTSITLPETLETLGYRAFYTTEARKVTELRIPDGIYFASYRDYAGDTAAETHQHFYCTNSDDALKDVWIYDPDLDLHADKFSTEQEIYGTTTLYNIFYNSSMRAISDSLTLHGYAGSTTEDLSEASDYYAFQAITGLTITNVTGQTVTVTASAKVGDALMIARYNRGKMTALEVVTMMANTISRGLDLGGTGETVKVFLLDGTSYIPLCAAAGQSG